MQLRRFVYLVVAAAVTSVCAVGIIAPGDFRASGATIATLAALALTAEVMGYLLPRGATGSIAFVPFLTALVLVPNVTALAAIAGATVISVAARRSRGLLKIAFNIAQSVTAYAVALLAYRLLGGVSLYQLQQLQVAEATIAVGIPMLIAYVTVFAINTLAVSHVVALSTQAKTLHVWRDNNISTIGLDILAIPLVFVFALVYAKYGAMLASLLWLPILGLRQLNTTNIELAQTNKELLELMIKSIEARDPYTSGHSRRVKEYAIKIARLLSLPNGEIEKIGTAALLHDVGKIYDKYAPILAKEDRLTAEEWAVIKEHPNDGANLIATMTRLRELMPAVKHHHENWDGTGYPDGLKADEIPLASRIIMFADTLDAMTTKRPYRGPLGERDVRAEIVRCRGRQFDPEIADRLLAKDFWSSLFPPRSRSTPRPNLLRVVSGGLTR